ncbi:hypothetical protein Cni_G23294 [Canna indica]|uniref:Reverse transcriptase domain-containing protein n=1 Tax=Canna indica TaxID=4628 RepID=A0AAQ3KTJ0_9LILI|nr:hypothetical protein Cni_G23294 [Canna indica]
MIQESHLEELEAEAYLNGKGRQWEGCAMGSCGRSGGIIMMWKKHSMRGRVVYKDEQCMNCVLEKENGKQFLITCIYASTNINSRSKLWKILGEFNVSKLPWMLVGDMNCIIEAKEKRGGNPFQENKAVVDFKEMIGNCGLVDAGFDKPMFIWSNKRKEGKKIAARLDRVLYTMKWFDWNLDIKVEHLNMMDSDHRPLLIKCAKSWDSREKRKNERDSKEFIGCLEANWKEANEKLRLLEAKEDQNLLSEKEVVGKRCLENKLIALSRQIKMKWWSKSMKSWIEGGDKNTKFFQNSVKLRRKRNKIEELLVEEVIVKENKHIVGAFAKWYEDLWSKEDDLDDIKLDGLSWCTITKEVGMQLEKPFSTEEIWNALAGLGKGKSPGKEGFIVEFFLHNWFVVNVKVKEEIDLFQKNGKLPTGWNETVLVMTPKMEKAKKIGDFRPIALCNVLYKVVAKILANRMRPYLNKIISPEQSAFVPGKSIQDNIMVAAEVIDSFHYSKARKPYLMLKLDLQRMTGSDGRQCMK